MQSASSDSSSPHTTVSPVPTILPVKSREVMVKAVRRIIYPADMQSEANTMVYIFLSNLPFSQKLIASLNVSRCIVFVHSGHSYD